MVRMTDFTLKAIGILLMLAALGFAVSKAPDRSLDSPWCARWAPPPSDFVELPWQGRRLLVHVPRPGPQQRPGGCPSSCIHGTGASLHTWEALGGRARARQRRVISFDLPGFGLTGPRMPTTTTSDARYIAFVHAICCRA